MKKSTNIVELENFDIQKEIETILNNSQEAIFQRYFNISLTKCYRSFRFTYKITINPSF
jgi:hypothetical protein